MLTDRIFAELVEAGARAPSADNMQGWEFARHDGAIAIHLARQRMLPTDVGKMFGWVGVGAAAENVVIAAARRGLTARVECRVHGQAVDQPVLVRLAPGGVDDPLADRIAERVTNRCAYDDAPLATPLLDQLAGSVRALDAGVHWATGRANLEQMAAMDASSTYIRLEHRPLHDELFDVLRFSRREVEQTRHGLDFASLGVPFVLVSMARLLRHWSINKLVSRLGLGHVVARLLASRLRTAGALCLITARRPGAAGYVEAGRAMERLWLAATARGLAVQPHGVLPQYLTKAAVEPATLLPRYVAAIDAQRAPFERLFPAAAGERPAIVLRVGRPLGTPAQRSVRLPLDQIVR